jgi:hypothetical protein
MMSLSSFSEGIDEFSLIKLSSRVEDTLTSSRAFRDGTVNCGTDRFTLTSVVTELIAETADCITEFAVEISDWIEVRTALSEVVTPEEIYVAKGMVSSSTRQDQCTREVLTASTAPMSKAKVPLTMNSIVHMSNERYVSMMNPITASMMVRL